MEAENKARLVAEMVLSWAGHKQGATITFEEARRLLAHLFLTTANSLTELQIANRPRPEFSIN